MYESSDEDQASWLYWGFCRPIGGMCQILIYYSWAWTNNCDFIMPNLNDVSMQLFTYKEYLPLFSKYFGWEESNNKKLRKRPQDFICNRNEKEWFEGKILVNMF